MAAAARLTANGAPAALASTPTMAAMSVALGCWPTVACEGFDPCRAHQKLPSGAQPRPRLVHDHRGHHCPGHGLGPGCQPLGLDPPKPFRQG